MQPKKPINHVWSSGLAVQIHDKMSQIVSQEMTRTVNLQSMMNINVVTRTVKTTKVLLCGQ